MIELPVRPDDIAGTPMPLDGLGDRGSICVSFTVPEPIVIARQCPAQVLFAFDVPNLGTCTFQLHGEVGVSVREINCLWTRRLPDGKNWRNNNHYHSFAPDRRYHMAWTWDADAGHFQTYLNGYPMKPTRAANWCVDGPIRSLTFSAGTATIHSLDCLPDTLTDAHAAELAGVPYPVAPDPAIGMVYDAVPLDPPDGEPIYHNPLRHSRDLEGWVMEGPADVILEDGWAVMRAHDPIPTDHAGHHTWWCPAALPQDYRIDWDWMTLNGKGLCILFTDALGLGGEDVMDPSLAPRNGLFPQYWRGDIRIYHFSYHDPGEWIRANKNPQKCMFAVARRPVYDVGRPYHLTVVKRGNTIRLGVDGLLVLEATDDPEKYGPTHYGGKLALRQMVPGITAYRHLQIQAL